MKNENTNRLVNFLDVKKKLLKSGLTLWKIFLQLIKKLLRRP